MNPRIEALVNAYRAHGVYDPESGGYFITSGELADIMGISRTEVSRRIKFAESAGVLRREKKKVQYEYITILSSTDEKTT